MKRLLQACYFLLFMGFLVASPSAFAQFAIVLDNIEGRPISAKLHGEVEGEPNFFKGWTKATVHLTNGEKLGNVQVKYDLVDDLLIFTDKSGELFYFRHPVKEFWLHPEGAADVHFRSGYPEVDGRFGTNFYQVLADGKIALLKSYRKNLQEAQVYGSTTKKFFLNDSENLYLFVNNRMIRVRKNEKAVLDAVGNEADKAALKQLIAQQKLNLRKEEDLIALFRSFNAQ